MFDTFLISLRLRIAYKINSFLHGLKSLPLIRRLLPTALYDHQGLKAAATIVALLKELSERGLDTIMGNGTPGRELESLSKALLNNDELKRRLNGILLPREAERLKLDREKFEVEKKKLELPEKLVNVIHCKNPRCITVAESQLDAIFVLSDADKHTYRCAYCETAYDKK